MERRRDVWAAVLAGTGALLIWPLWLSGPPAMPDYAAHLAGYYLLGGAARTPPLSHFYGIAWGLIPNLAGEAVIPLLAQAMPLETAAKLFLSAALVMWVAGPALIHRVLFGRVGPAPVAASLFAYNVNFMWGFINYYFAAGLCLVVFAAWIAGGSWPRTVRVPIFAAAAVVVYFCHIAAAALLALLIGAYEGSRACDRAARPARRGAAVLAETALVFSPVAVLFLMRPGADLDGDVSFNLVGTFPARIVGMIERGFSSPAYIVLTAVVVLCIWGARNGRLKIHPRMRFVVAAVAFVALLAPESVMGGWGLHLRFPAVAASLLFASSEIRLGGRTTLGLCAAAMAALAWMSVTLAGQWKGYDRQVAAFRTAVADLPRGSRLMTVVDPAARTQIDTKLYWHMAEFAIIDRSAFTALMFATRGQHAVYVKPAFAPFAARSAEQGTPPGLGELPALAAGRADGAEGFKANHSYLLNFPCHYDEAVLVHGRDGPLHVPRFLKIRHRGRFFSIYDIARPRTCPARRGSRGEVRALSARQDTAPGAA